MTERKTETEAARRTTTPRIEVELLPAAASDDATVMERITHLTNEVYAACGPRARPARRWARSPI